MVKSHRSKRHNKKHRGGEGEIADNNSVLNMDEPTTASVTTTEPVVSEPVVPATEPATTEEEKKGWFSNLFGGSKTKRVRFRMTRKNKRSSAKRSSAKRTKRTKRTKRSKRTKRKGSSRK